MRDTTFFIIIIFPNSGFMAIQTSLGSLFACVFYNCDIQ